MFADTSEYDTLLLTGRSAGHESQCSDPCDQVQRSQMKYKREIRAIRAITLASKGLGMPKAKPISLHPLSFDAAIKALIKSDPGSKREPGRKPKPATKSKPTRK